MDLVASLEWVKTNIENFGGDPGRVMIFGQSGGGAKTSTILATPAAKGAFPSCGGAERLVPALVYKGSIDARRGAVAGQAQYSEDAHSRLAKGFVAAVA